MRSGAPAHADRALQAALAESVGYGPIAQEIMCASPGEEVIEAKFSALLARLCFSEDIQKWMVDGLHQSREDVMKEHHEAVKRLQTEHCRSSQRLSTMYIDKLDGRIDAIMYDRMASEWRKEQQRCLREIGRYRTAEQSYMDEGVALLSIAKDSQRLFEKRPAADKRGLLNFVLSNSTWRDGELTADFPSTV